MARLHYLALHQFRNYKRVGIELGPQINIFVGKNGQGKTNCLEAIALLIAGKSFRTSFFKEMILNGENAFEVQAVFERYQIEQSLKIQYSSHKRLLTHNATSYSSFVPLVGLIQGVFFSSFQNALIRGTPSVRRRFLDLQCAQIDPLYLHHLKRYQKALKDRNHFLREKKIPLLNPYEILLAQSAPYLIQKRLSILSALQPLVQQQLHELTALTEPFSFDYVSPLKNENLKELTSDSFVELFEKYRKRDLHIGMTSFGPHKDDLYMLLQDLEAKKFASEGQVQSLIHALYFAQHQLIQREVSDTPLFCIDDVGQNLDQTRQKHLYQKLERLGQVFLSTPDIPRHSFSCDVRLFEVQAGQIKAL